MGLVAAALNSQSRRHMGHFWSLPSVESHLLMHCRWKAWLQLPQTTALSSPGNLASGGQPSKGALQIPQTSSPAQHAASVEEDDNLIQELSTGTLLEIVEGECRAQSFPLSDTPGDSWPYSPPFDSRHLDSMSDFNT